MGNRSRHPHKKDSSREARELGAANENKIDGERQRASASAQNGWRKRDGSRHEKEPKKGKGRGNKRRQSHSSPGSCLSKSRIMEAPVDDQCISMEDLGPPSPPKFPDELRCSLIKSVQMEMRILTARKTYVSELLEIKKETNGPRTETAQKSEEMTSLEEKINILEGKMHELLPCPIALCSHNSKNKAVKRTADPVNRPAKFTAKATNNNNKSNNISKNKNDVTDFVFPKKTSKIVPVKELEQLKTTNAFAALNTATVDAEDVSPPKPKIKPIFMRIISSYNLILQELHRSYPHCN
ncbi:uncharacterized protein TNCV_2972001 [Trichonephila clavipes]|nr:uncharacterized protein TNCV_2972001 [Trichonephila clavipes]